MDRRRLKRYRRDSRGPLRDVVRVGEFKNRAPNSFKYVLELECGHTIQRHLLRGDGDVRTHCSGCLIEAEDALVEAYKRGEVKHDHPTRVVLRDGECPACDATRLITWRNSTTTTTTEG